MPPVPAVPGAVKVVHTWQYETRAFVQVQHLGKGNTTNWTNANCLATAESVYNAWAAVHPILNSNAVYESCEVQDLAADNAFAVYTPSTPVQGSLTNQAGPIQVCALMSWTLGVKYRGGKPRTYLSGLDSEVPVSPYAISAGTADTIVGYGEAYISAIQEITVNEDNLFLATVAYSRDKEPLAEPLVLPIVGCSVSTRLASQRRRVGKEDAYARELP